MAVQSRAISVPTSTGQATIDTRTMERVHQVQPRARRGLVAFVRRTWLATEGLLTTSALAFHEFSRYRS